MRREQAGRLGLGRQVGVEAEHDVGLGRRAFELHAVEQRHAVGDGHEFDVAAAFGLERLLDLRAGTPFGGEALIGVDGELVLAPRRAAADSAESKGEEQLDRVRIGASFVWVERE